MDCPSAHCFIHCIFQTGQGDDQCQAPAQTKFQIELKMDKISNSMSKYVDGKLGSDKV